MQGARSSAASLQACTMRPAQRRIALSARFACYQMRSKAAPQRQPAPACFRSPAGTLHCKKLPAISAPALRYSKPPLEAMRKRGAMAASRSCLQGASAALRFAPLTAAAPCKQKRTLFGRARLRIEVKLSMCSGGRFVAASCQLASGFVMLLARERASSPPKPCHNQSQRYTRLSCCLQEEEQAARQPNEPLQSKPVRVRTRLLAKSGKSGVPPMPQRGSHPFNQPLHHASTEFSASSTHCCKLER